MTLRTLSLFAAALLVLRVLLLLADLDPIEERVMEVFEYSPTPWAEGPARTLYDREELYTATAAEAIRQDLAVPISMYQFMEYGGGSLLVTLLAVPILSVLGPYYLAFKTIALAVTLLCGLSWTWLAFAWFGRGAGLAMALLLVFAPSVFVRTMLIAKGDHAEAAGWIGLTLVFASLAARGVLGRLPGEVVGGARISEAIALLSGSSHNEKASEDAGFAATAARATTVACTATAARAGTAGTRWAFAAGFLLGLGVFLTYSTVPVLATTFAIALLATQMRPRRIWIAGFLGLGSGLLPWIWNLIQSEGRALYIYESTLGHGEGFTAARQRIVDLASTGFFASYDLPAVRNLTGFVFGAAVVFGWILLARSALGSLKSDSRFRDPRSVAALIVVLAALAHLAAFCISAPDASSRYIIPAYPLLLLSVASSVGFGNHPASMLDRTVDRRSWILPGLLVIMGGAAQIGTFATGTYRSLATPLRATDWPLLGEIVGQKLAPESIARLPEAMQRHFWVGFGKRVFGFVDRAEWEEAIALAPPNRRAMVWEGIGIAWVESGLVLNAGTFVETLGEVDRTAIVRGMERYGEIVFAPMIVAGEDLAAVRFRMAGSIGSRLPASQARVLNLLQANGARVPSARGLFPEEQAAGRGWAQYRGIGRNGLIVRKAPGSAASPSSREGAWTHPADSPDQWSGFIAAFSRDLELIDPDWLLEPGNPDGPSHLGELLERSGRGLSQEMQAALFTAAGRAAAVAWLDPSLDPDARATRASWVWTRSIPNERHADFERGLIGSDEE